MVEQIQLIKRTWEGNRQVETKREVLCTIKSVGQSEFYQAHGTDYKPELKIQLADYLDYDEEQLIVFNGKWWRVIRIYRTGHALEITVERAPEEEREHEQQNQT